MNQERLERIFVVEANGRAIVAFEAVSHREASELRDEEWFREELAALRSEGKPVWDGLKRLLVRTASTTERTEFQIAKVSATQNNEEGILLIYLIPLDGAK